MKINLITDFKKRLSNFEFRQIDLNQDYEYYVKISPNGKRCHLNKSERSIESLTNGTIKEEDNYLSYVIDVSLQTSTFINKKINCFYKILIIIKYEDNIIKDYFVFFPPIDDNQAKKIRDQLFE